MHMYVCTDGLTFETGFIRLTLSKSQPKKELVVKFQFCAQPARNWSISHALLRRSWFMAVPSVV